MEEQKRKRGRPRKVVPLVQTTTLEEYVQESLDFLREYEPKEGYFVGFSGGKDSIVTMELCRMAGVKFHPFFSCTRIDPPQVYKFIHQYYPQVTWLYPTQTFWDGIRYASPPTRQRRWCCDTLKKAPAKRIPLRHRVMGIRAEESARRASHPRIDVYKKGEAYGQTVYKPIFYWPEWAVWDFIADNVLPYPTLYDEGFGRLGCIVCPYIMGRTPGAIAHRSMSMQMWPGIWKVFEKTVKTWWETKVHALRSDILHVDADDYWNDYLNGFEYER